MRRLLPLLLLVPLAGCRTVVQPPEGEVDRREIYQRIANALPRATFGWGTKPGVVEMTASARADGPPPEVDPPKATERGFRLAFEVYRPRNVWIPYSTLREVSYSWEPVPNLFFCLLPVLPIQVVRATVVFEAKGVPGLLDWVGTDTRRLEAISRETNLPAPWAFAQQVKHKILADEATWGEGMLALHFDRVAMIPAWIPWGGEAERIAEAFAWVMAHPDEPEVEPEEEPKDPGGG